MRRLLQV